MNNIMDIYIETGIRLRKEYLEVSKVLDDKMEEFNIILERMEKHSSELSELSSNLDKMNQTQALAAVNSKMDTLAKEAKNVEILCGPLNSKLDELKIAEEQLYNAIKSNHPELSDTDIKNEFIERVIKKVDF